MKFTISFIVAALLNSAAATPFKSYPRGDEILGRSNKPPAFFLAGDSTTAAQTFPDSGGGWGTGFFATLQNGALGSNYGQNGATTVSFAAGGQINDLVESVSRYTEYFNVFVTIQFGHNDQKAAANISIPEFSANLAAFAAQVKSLGAIPILTTSLSRRNFNTSLSPPSIILDLAPQVAAALSVAQSTNTTFIDLNLASTNYLNSIGQADANLYDLAAGDTTHLNPAGSIVFGYLVRNLISSLDGVSELVAGYFKVNETLDEALKSGTFILP